MPQDYRQACERGDPGVVGIASMAALLCSMVSIRLMMVVEGAQVIVSGTIGQLPPPDRVVAMAIGAQKYFVLKFGIVFFSWISSLIFSLEGMYSEKAAQKAASTVMNTVLISNKIKSAAKHTRHAAKKVRRAATHPRKSGASQ